MGDIRPIDQAYSAGVLWARDVAVSAAIEGGIRSGHLSPGARGMAWPDVRHQVAEAWGEEVAQAVALVGLEAIPADPLSGEWAGEPTPETVRAQYASDDDDDTWSCVDAWEAGAADLAAGAWGWAVTADEVHAYVLRARHAGVIPGSFV